MEIPMNFRCPEESFGASHSCTLLHDSSVFIIRKMFSSSITVYSKKPCFFMPLVYIFSPSFLYLFKSFIVVVIFEFAVLLFFLQLLHQPVTHSFKTRNV